MLMQTRIYPKKYFNGSVNSKSENLFKKPGATIIQT